VIEGALVETTPDRAPLPRDEVDMKATSILLNAITGVLVTCALVVSVTVIRTAHEVSSAESSRPAPSRHVAAWESLLKNRTPSLGAFPSAVHIVEFSDYQCPYCRGLEEVLQRLVKDHPGTVAVIRYDFPLTKIHQYAYPAAIAAECAAEQGVYERYQSLLFENGAHLGDVNWMRLAEQANIRSPKSFSDCFRQQRTAARVDHDKEIGEK
jgi:protein-disulfide isomerase